MTTTLSSSEFVESCGAVLFNSTRDKVCLITVRNVTTIDGDPIWVLPKGRRNCGESRKEAALREVQEETGYECQLLPVTMLTRATSARAPVGVEDKARRQIQLTDHFMVTLRRRADKDLKLIYWFVAEVVARRSDGEKQFMPEFFGFYNALARLTYQDDRQCLRDAILLVERSVCDEIL